MFYYFCQKILLCLNLEHLIDKLSIKGALRYGAAAKLSKGK